MNSALSNPNSAAEQRARVLARLRQGPMTTLAARSELDVLHPAARVMELRDEGYCIETLRTREASECGRLHTVASYVLLPSGDGVSLPLAVRMMHGAGRRAAS
ncbi:MAG: helix-turn-helix domain-containing protein [Pseudomonadota bacterium]